MVKSIGKVGTFFFFLIVSSCIKAAYLHYLLLHRLVVWKLVFMNLTSSAVSG